MQEQDSTKKELNPLPRRLYNINKDGKLHLWPTVKSFSNNVLNTDENKLYFIRATREDARLQIFLPNYRSPIPGNQGPLNDCR